MKPPYTTIEQTGEMAWGQPTFKIRRITEDKVVPNKYGKHQLIIGEQKYSRKRTDQHTGKTTHREWSDYTTVKVDIQNNMIVASPTSFQYVSDMANYFGERLPDEFWKEYSDILVPYL